MALLWLGIAAVSGIAEAAGEEFTHEQAAARWPLIYAAGEGDARAVRSLLSGGDVRALLEQRSKDGESALHTAAIKGDPDTVKELLKAGHEVDPRTPPGAGISMTPLHWATFHGHEEMVRLLLEAGADPLAGDEHGKLPMQMAEEAGRSGVAAILRRRLAHS